MLRSLLMLTLFVSLGLLAGCSGGEEADALAPAPPGNEEAAATPDENAEAATALDEGGADSALSGDEKAGEVQ